MSPAATVSDSANQLKRGRGRPYLGKPTPVVMDPCEEAIAREMGDGVKSQGARLALRAVHMLGIDRAKLLAASYIAETESNAGGLSAKSKPVRKTKKSAAGEKT